MADVAREQLALLVQDGDRRHARPARGHHDAVVEDREGAEGLVLPRAELPDGARVGVDRPVRVPLELEIALALMAHDDAAVRPGDAEGALVGEVADEVVCEDAAALDVDARHGDGGRGAGGRRERQRRDDARGVLPARLGRHREVSEGAPRRR